jgi:hypothetical protein
MKSLRDSALEYVAAGWKVLPCTLGKRPMIGGGFHSASNDPEVIEKWWTRCPTASIGAPVPRSLAVVDVDVAHDGLKTLAGLQDAYDPLPITLTSITGSGGAHHFFRHPGGELRQTAGLLGPGLDTRIPGKGYIILPPSPHPAGRCYEWIEPLAPPAAMPSWLVALLRPPPPPVRGSVPTVRIRDTYVRAAVEGEVVNVIGASIGSRNQTLHRAAVKLGTLVGAGVLAEHEAIDVLVEAAGASGYVSTDGERTARQTIQSGLAWGVRHPRQVDR